MRKIVRVIPKILYFTKFERSIEMRQNIRLSGYQIIRIVVFVIIFLHSSFDIRHSALAMEAPRFYGDEVVVTAARLPSEAERTPWDTNYLNQKELNRFVNIGQAVKILPGVDWIFLRGLRGAELHPPPGGKCLAGFDYGRRDEAEFTLARHV